MAEKLKSFYFKHDENAANDIKLMAVRSQLAMEGYGIYWFLLEQLSMAGGRMQLKMIPMLSTIMQTTTDKVMSVVKNYELFVVDEDGFFSERLNRQLEQRGTLSEAGRKAGLKSAEMRKLRALPPTTVEPPLNDSPTTVQPEEKRIEEKTIEKKRKSLSTNVDGYVFEKSILAIIQSIKSEKLGHTIREYKLTDDRIRLIKNREADFKKQWPSTPGMPERDFYKACKYAFEYKSKEWFGNENMFNYFEPETLLSKKFVKYLEAAEQNKGVPYVGEPKKKEEEKVVYHIPK